MKLFGMLLLSMALVEINSTHLIRFCSNSNQCHSNECCMRIGRSKRNPSRCKTLGSEGGTCSVKGTHGVYHRFCPCSQNLECHITKAYYIKGKCVKPTPVEPKTTTINAANSTLPTALPRTPTNSISSTLDKRIVLISSSTASPNRNIDGGTRQSSSSTASPSGITDGITWQSSSSAAIDETSTVLNVISREANQQASGPDIGKTSTPKSNCTTSSSSGDQSRKRRDIPEMYIREFLTERKMVPLTVIIDNPFENPTVFFNLLKSDNATGKRESSTTGEDENIEPAESTDS